MVLLVAKLSKFYSKMENHYNHHHDQPEKLSASLEAFRSDVSNCLNQLLSNSKPGSEILSFLWIQNCFEVIPIINKTFAQLVVSIDYPMSKWEASFIEEYLKYSFNLLEFFNAISSSLSHLGQARLPLSHALTLVENSPSHAIKLLQPIQLKNLTKNFKEQPSKEGVEEKFFSEKERVIHQALIEMKSIGFWVCGIVLAGLCGDDKLYVELRKSGGGFVSSSLSGLGSSICEEIVQKRGALKEVRELNKAVTNLVAAIEIGKSDKESEELRRRLEGFEKLMEAFEKEVNNLFSEVLAGRNELLNSIRHQKH